MFCSVSLKGADELRDAAVLTPSRIELSFEFSIAQRLDLIFFELRRTGQAITNLLNAG
jgi:hypothetical protein